VLLGFAIRRPRIAHSTKPRSSYARSVLTAVLGMAAVTWYSLGGQISDEEIIQEEKIRQDVKEKKKRARREWGSNMLRRVGVKS